MATKKEVKGPSMFETFQEFKETKNIDRTTLVSVLEESFRNVIAKMFGSDENFDVIVNPDKGDFEIHRNRIVIEIDHADGVWIEDCADLSRFLQEKLGEELGDYELEVGSAGIGQPFKVIQQYRNHIGKDVEVLASDGKKYQGVLKEVSDDDAQFVVTVKEKQQVEGKKRPVLVEVDKTFTIADIKYCKYLLNFK